MILRKKKILYPLIIVALIILAVLAYRIVSNDDVEAPNILSFKLSDYQSYIDSNQIGSDGYVSDKEAAERIAEAVWRTSDEYKGIINSLKPYKVSYDAQSKVWLVEGANQNDKDGPVPHILIQQSDGKILSYWATADKK